MTWRDQPVSEDEQKHFCPSPANKTHSSHGQKSQDSQVPDLPLSGCVALGILLAALGFGFLSCEVGALRGGEG